MTPLHLAPKHHTEYSPEEWKDYVEGLFLAPTPTEKAPDCSVRRNAKGTPVLTIRNRKPKWILRSEVEDFARTLRIPQSEFFLFAKSKAHIVHTLEEGKNWELNHTSLKEIRCKPSRK